MTGLNDDIDDLEDQGPHISLVRAQLPPTPEPALPPSRRNYGFMGPGDKDPFTSMFDFLDSLLIQVDLVITLSTSHLSGPDALDGCSDFGDVIKTGYGYMVHSDVTRYTDLPDSVLDCTERIRSMLRTQITIGSHGEPEEDVRDFWLRFDADGPTIPLLRVYDW